MDSLDSDDGCGDTTESEGDDSDDEITPQLRTSQEQIANVEGKACKNTKSVLIWEFPDTISQSNLDGRNGSSTCSVIALVFANESSRANLDIPLASLTLDQEWVNLICCSIRIGNQLYDNCRSSLPQRFLSAAEAYFK